MAAELQRMQREQETQRQAELQQQQEREQQAALLSTELPSDDIAVDFSYDPLIQIGDRSIPLSTITQSDLDMMTEEEFERYSALVQQDEE